MAYKERVRQFDDALAENSLDFRLLRELCFGGIPEGAGRRAALWRILLHYLPSEKAEWPAFLSAQRKLYQQFLDDLILVSNSAQEEEVEDHPLNPNPKSKWQSFFKDNEVLLQIDKDVRRLCPDIAFFGQATKAPNVSVVGGKFERLHQRVQQTRLESQSLQRVGLGLNKLSLVVKKTSDDYEPLDKGEEAHWEVVQRILFLYAKLNPGQSYVQGMNEIIGPIYYTFASDPRPEWREFAEADCFFCFTNLMSDIRDFFIKTLDEAESGISGIMTRLVRQVRELDFKVQSRLDAQDIKPQYFAFRWLSLMLSQEFALPDVLRLWDSLLSDESRRDFLIDICTAMILLQREQILLNDFADNMKMLQNYPLADVQIILSKAASISKVPQKLSKS